MTRIIVWIAEFVVEVIVAAIAQFAREVLVGWVGEIAETAIAEWLTVLVADLTKWIADLFNE